MSILVRDLLDLPDHVSKGDFVQSLASSLQDPESTVATYAVTPALAENFRSALRSVTASLSNGRSQPVFLHGSFGSGKSHFMALLHLMLQGHPAPWHKSELHDVRADWAPLEGRRLMQLHYHMLSAKSFESAVFAEYVEHVRREHPDAVLPSLFRDQEVFDNAVRLRTTMGDGAFFAALNEGKAAVAGLGSLGGAQTWTAETFEATLADPSPEPRRRLFTDLVKTLLPAFATQTDRFVDVDEGLAEMSRHAASLGYDGLVLYLDELILWLASQSAAPAFVQREFMKLVKLKEAQDERRDIPIVAFIARQRDLSELMGDTALGSDRALIEETIAHHKSRFDTIELSDSNLRAIIPHRVVVARSADDRSRLEDGFEAMWPKAQRAVDTLQAGTANRDDFQQVYPFSPALIDVLVALSDRLQRDRTAIRILVEMLVEHLPDLELGEVVPVGDVFDLIAASDDAVDGPSKVAFQRARDLYLHDALPRIQQKHGALTSDVCQRHRPGHPVRIGCSGCDVARCRTDNRLVKTLLLASLVPKARPFDGLTVKRLVHLNHGSVQAPIETMQINLAATSLRELQRDVHAIKVGDDADPAVSISLQSIDLKPILQRADEQDRRERRRFVLRQLLWEQIGLQVDANVVAHAIDFRETRRLGRVRYGNVRTLGAEELRCPPDHEWQVVIDYPFDDKGYTPVDDERRLDEVRRELGGRPTSTLVWLPTFFSKQVEDDLGDLARLDHILDPQHLRSFLEHVPPDDRPRAQIDLQSLRDRKRAEVREAVRKAYGLTTPGENDPHVDRNREAQSHVHTLDENLDPRTPRAPGLAEALQHLAIQLLEARYPSHPRFGAKPTPARLNQVRRFLEELLDEPSGMLQAGRDDREPLRQIAEPLYLCRVHEQTIEHMSRRYDEIESLRAQQGEDAPSLEQVRSWIDPKGQLGLTPHVENLVAWLWAHQQRRVAMEGRTPVAWPSSAKLPERIVFTKPDLPSEEVWDRALTRAGTLGVTQRGKALNAQNATQLAKSLRELAAGQSARASLRLPSQLEERLGTYAPGQTSHRLSTAHTVAGLLAALGQPTDRALLEALAAADLTASSPVAAGQSLGRAVDALQVLEDPSPWTVFSVLSRLLSDDRFRARARSILDRVAEVLISDEHNKPLKATIGQLVEEASVIIAPPGPGPTPPTPPTPPPKPPAGWRETWSERRDGVPASEALAQLDRLRQQLEAQVADGDGRVNFQIVVEKPESRS